MLWQFCIRLSAIHKSSDSPVTIHMSTEKLALNILALFSASLLSYFALGILPSPDTSFLYFLRFSFYICLYCQPVEWWYYYVLSYDFCPSTSGGISSHGPASDHPGAILPYSTLLFQHLGRTFMPSKAYKNNMRNLYHKHSTYDQTNVIPNFWFS